MVDQCVGVWVCVCVCVCACMCACASVSACVCTRERRLITIKIQFNSFQIQFTYPQSYSLLTGHIMMTPPLTLAPPNGKKTSRPLPLIAQRSSWGTLLQTSRGEEPAPPIGRPRSPHRRGRVLARLLFHLHTLIRFKVTHQPGGSCESHQDAPVTQVFSSCVSLQRLLLF